MYRNAGSAGVDHQRLQKKRRRRRASDGAAGPSCSLAADTEAVAAALASLAEKPIACVPRGKPQKIKDLTNPYDRMRAEKYANRVLGQEPITAAARLIKQPRRTRKGAQ